MLTLTGSEVRGFCDGVTRRNFLRIGGLTGLSAASNTANSRQPIVSSGPDEPSRHHRLPTRRADSARDPLTPSRPLRSRSVVRFRASPREFPESISANYCHNFPPSLTASRLFGRWLAWKTATRRFSATLAARADGHRIVNLPAVGRRSVPLYLEPWGPRRTALPMSTLHPKWPTAPTTIVARTMQPEKHPGLVLQDDNTSRSLLKEMSRRTSSSTVSTSIGSTLAACCCRHSSRESPRRTTHSKNKRLECSRRAACPRHST